jgi:VIT1/CCC1 family predicted Fe2+/Mn2+ transporter
MIAADPVRNIVDLASNAVAKAADLVQLEFRLARRELADKLDAWKAGSGLILAGAVFGIGALIMLLQAAVAALVEAGLKPWIASLIVGAASLVLAGLFGVLGRNRFVALNPDRSFDQLSRDKRMVQEKMP